jgi:hypothetical protein
VQPPPALGPKMASTYSDDDIKKMTVAQLMSYLTDRKVTLPAAVGAASLSSAFLILSYNTEYLLYK